MRIVSWNCNGAFRRKYPALDNLNADVLIIQECEDPAQSTNAAYKEWAKNYLWIGKNKNSGLGVFVNQNHSIEKLDWSTDTFQLFLPFRLNQQLNFLAVWTKQANSPTFQYIGQLWKYLQLNKDLFSQYKPIICGDFNSNKIWDKWDRWWNHSDVVRELSDLGISSLYHHHFQEEQGKELQPTFYLQRNLAKPYHIDYAFIPEAMMPHSSIQIGKSENWLKLSDHMPLLVLLSE